jgi:uncharacterized OB-fold protein
MSQISTAHARPRPSLTPDTAWWWEALDRGELLVQRCSECGVVRHPPEPCCASCQSLDWTTSRAAGTGTLHSFVVVHEPRVAGFDTPYVVALVDLPEGVRVIANVVDAEPDALAIGMDLILDVREVGGIALPFCRPA